MKSSSEQVIPREQETEAPALLEFTSLTTFNLQPMTESPGQEPILQHGGLLRSTTIAWIYHVHYSLSSHSLTSVAVALLSPGKGWGGRCSRVTMH